ncbi:hypothetical protein BHE74_00048205 [Ensete ventricosum]|nr:hypothetical protein BHE74_00048205 [Ensete ventricosum]
MSPNETSDRSRLPDAAVDELVTTSVDIGDGRRALCRQMHSGSFARRILAGEWPAGPARGASRRRSDKGVGAKLLEWPHVSLCGQRAIASLFFYLWETEVVVRHSPLRASLSLFRRPPDDRFLVPALLSDGREVNLGGGAHEMMWFDVTPRKAIPGSSGGRSSLLPPIALKQRTPFSLLGNEVTRHPYVSFDAGHRSGLGTAFMSLRPPTFCVPSSEHLPLIPSRMPPSVSSLHLWSPTVMTNRTGVLGVAPLRRSTSPKHLLCPIKPRRQKGYLLFDGRRAMTAATSPNALRRKAQTLQVAGPVGPRLTRLLLGLGVNPTMCEVGDEAAGEAVALVEEAAVVEAGGGDVRRLAMLPVVFIGGRLLGGLDRLVAVHITGELVPILKEAGALWL